MRRALVSSGKSVTLETLPAMARRSESSVEVRVEAAGLNALDFVTSLEQYGKGLLDLELLRGKSFVLGQEFSGRVVGVGRNVMDLCVGDEVWGAVDPWSSCGTLTDELSVHEADVARKPASLTHEQAAAFPFAAMTVWRSVIEEARRKRARSALVYGAAGNVGLTVKSLLEAMVPSMQTVVGVGREGYNGDDQFDIVVDAASSQGDPLDLERFVASSGSYVTFNGPWLTRVTRNGLLQGSLESIGEIFEKKAQSWTNNGSSYRWGVMRASGNKALTLLADAFDKNQLSHLSNRQISVISLEEAAQDWESLMHSNSSKLIVKM